MTTKPYERRDNESDPAYEAFALYRDMGIQRSIEVVARDLSKSVQLIKRWSALNDWVIRVRAYDDYIDAAARKKIDNEAIKRRADMLKRHALAGKVLQQKGVDYIGKNGVDKSADAISAIAKGVEIERKAEGFPDWMFEIAAQDDDDLYREYNRLLAALAGVGEGNAAAGTGTASADAADEIPVTDAD